MRKSQIESILVEQTKRRNTIISFLFFIFSISLFAFLLFYIYFKNKENNYVTYDEKSDIFYKVYLKENEFFEDEYLGSHKQYIASLIEKITAKFQYELSFDSDKIEYKYEYKIDANVSVYDEGTNNVLFSKTENLVPKEEYTTSEKNVNINQTVNIDYNYFNNLINKFVNIYDLDEVESVLSIDMTVNTIGSCEDFLENEENSSVISLAIPLTTKTVAIEISNDLIDTENNVMLCETDKSNYILLLIGILVVIIDLIIIGCLLVYEKKSRTVDTIYIKKLKKILNNYGAYIQEITNVFNFDGYRLVKIATFEDLLEIRDTIKQPILMKQNKEKNTTYFVIPSSFNQLYVYRLKIGDIDNNK